jgi:prepilin-type N-terminal cleavage/methylation domain-containing protein
VEQALQNLVSMQRGFSLVETLVGASILAAALVGLAHLLTLAVQIGAAARATTMTAVVTEQKLEELRTLSWASIAALGSGTDYVDAAGQKTCVAAGTQCAGAAYLRRWSISPAPFSNAVLIIEVDTTLVGNGQARSTFVTARGRMSQ